MDKEISLSIIAWCVLGCFTQHGNTVEQQVPLRESMSMRVVAPCGEQCQASIDLAPDVIRVDALDASDVQALEESMRVVVPCGKQCQTSIELAPDLISGDAPDKSNVRAAASEDCDFVEVVESNTHELMEGVYERSATLQCEEEPVWVKMVGQDMPTVDYIYRLVFSNNSHWAISDTMCSSDVYAYTRSDNPTPDGNIDWLEVTSQSFESSTMSVSCQSNPCETIELKNVPSTHIEMQGQYTRNGVCTYRPAYKRGNYYIYYALLEGFSGWVVTENGCTESEISYGIRNSGNTGYPQSSSYYWQYYYGAWRTSTSMDVTCFVAAPPPPTAAPTAAPACDIVELKNAPSTHGFLEGQYTRNGVCTYRTAYRSGSYYMYYAVLIGFSGWVVTEDPCGEIEISVYIRNPGNTDYPQSSSYYWQYYYSGWQTSTTMDVICYVAPPPAPPAPAPTPAPTAAPTAGPTKWVPNACSNLHYKHNVAVLVLWKFLALVVNLP